jgi:hypothetical protein
MRRPLIAMAIGALALASSATPARAADNCVLVAQGNRLVLQASCTTDATILVPDGKTLDGNGHTITGVDPIGGHFRGAVVANAGARASVVDLTVTVAVLVNACDAGADRLRGILLEGASGRIARNTVVDINQGLSGCQEGNGIEVRNLAPGAPEVHVDIHDNVVTGYQKTGIVTNGAVRTTIRGNRVDGLGPVGYIARNGIQVGYGARATVVANVVAGNAYTGAGWVSGGILVVGGPYYGGEYTRNTQITLNRVEGNDVGVYISQFEADLSAPPTPTSINVVANRIVNDGCTNGLYQAGVSDAGTGDRIIANGISGVGYAAPCGVEIDAEEPYAHDATVRGNK